MKSPLLPLNLPLPRNLWPFLKLFVIPVLLIFSLNSKAQAQEITFTDDAGQTLTLKTPRRIIALYSAFNEILLQIGAKDLIVAKTVQDTSKEFKSLPSIGTHMRPNLELVAAYQPDLVLQLQGRAEAKLQTKALRALGLKVAEFSLNSIDDIFKVTEILGRVTKHEAKAYSQVIHLKKRLQEIEARHLGQKPLTVVFEIRSPELLVAGDQSICKEIIQIAGGQNLITTPKKIVRINEEALLKLDPWAYIIQKGPMNPNPLPLAERPHLKLLRASQNGRTLLVAEELFSRPGPRIVEACDLLEKWLHTQAKP